MGELDGRGGSRTIRKLPWLPRWARDVSSLGARRGLRPVVRVYRSENNPHLQVRSRGQLADKSSKRAQTGEPFINSRDSRYLIDFITGHFRRFLWIGPAW